MSLYVVFVPLAGIAIGQRIHGAQIVGAILATIGLYFLCMQSSFSLGKGEMWMLLGTAVFSAHILFVGRFASTVNAVEMALAGWVLLGQTLSLREIVGCAFMITGMIVTRTYGMIKEKHEHVWREVEMKP